MNYNVSFERTVTRQENVGSFAVFGSVGAVAIFKTLADAEDFTRYIANDQRHTRTFIAEIRLDVRCEVVTGEIAANNSFVERNATQKLGLNGGNVFVIYPERLSGGGWSQVWPPMPVDNGWGLIGRA